MLGECTSSNDKLGPF